MTRDGGVRVGAYDSGARLFREINWGLDPYINVDPGTIEPVPARRGSSPKTAPKPIWTGHYERFHQRQDGQAQQLHHRPDLRDGDQEGARGEYLGKTVQVIPHITDEIKAHIKSGGGRPTWRSSRSAARWATSSRCPFLEAIRQMGIEGGRQRLFHPPDAVPYIPTAGELKTKPTQHSVKELREIGIQPDVLLCRADRPVPRREGRKIALFCNVSLRPSSRCLDADSIYKIPGMLHDQMLDEIVSPQARHPGAGG